MSFRNNFNRSLIAHELGYQWFGNKITCGSWRDIWLNEGFATYLASLVIKNFDANDAFEFEVNKNLISKNNTTTLGNSNFIVSDLMVVDPNPSSNLVTIQMREDLILNGVELFKSIVQKVASFDKKIVSVAYLSSGIYMVNLTTNSGVFSKKLVKN